MRATKQPREASTAGAEKNTRPVITRGTPAWTEWMEYFAWTGHPHAAPTSYANKIGRLTVYSEFPEMHDPDWRRRDPKPIQGHECPPKVRFPISSGRPLDAVERDRQRGNIARMHAELMAVLRSISSSRILNGSRDGRNAGLEKAKAQEWLRTYQSGANTDPVAVSDRLSGYLDAMSGHQREAAE